MYIIIKGGTIVKSETISNEYTRNCTDKDVTIIDISDSENPKLLADNTWYDLPETK